MSTVSPTQARHAPRSVNTLKAKNLLRAQSSRESASKYSVAASSLTRCVGRAMSVCRSPPRALAVSDIARSATASAAVITHAGCYEFALKRGDDDDDDDGRLCVRGDHKRGQNSNE
jgi:hypothetical protein